MHSSRQKILTAVGSVLLIAAIVAFVQARRAPRSVPTIRLAYAPFVIALPENGVVQYPQIQTISAQIAGNFGRIYVKAGERVAQGQLLATIENQQITANAAGAEAAYGSAIAKAQSAVVTGGSNVVQAQANLETAQARLAQAQQDLANGVQSGLGYGETTAAAERARADADLASAAATLREARRVYVAYRALYNDQAVSRDQLDQSEAKYEQAQAAYNQALSAHTALATQLAGSRTVLEDNLRSAREVFAQAQAQLEAARVESRSGDVAAARAEAARAQSAYAFAREQAEATAIRAPYSATVLSVASEKSDPLRPLQPGDAIDVGQPLLTLAAQQNFVVRTRVDEQDVINVHVGQRVRITGEDFPGHTLSGHVAEIASVAQKSGEGTSGARTVATTIVIERPPLFLRDGMSADVDILTTDLSQAIAVPNDAVLRDGQVTYVFAVHGGSVHRQPVRIGAANETASLIVSGLRPGDVIVTQNATGLRDGDAITAATPVPNASR